MQRGLFDGTADESNFCGETDGFCDDIGDVAKALFEIGGDGEVSCFYDAAGMC